MGSRNSLLLVSMLATALGFSTAARADGDIGYERAAKVALERVPGQVESIERDRELGKVVYEVEIRGSDGVEWEVTVDAQNGQVLEVERDD